MRKHDSTLYSIALAVLAACGTNDPQPAPGPATISGTNRRIHWDENGTSTIIGEPPNRVFIEAELPEGPVPATLAEDGTFTVDASPTGSYWLRFIDGGTSEDVYILTDATQIDLGRDVVGHSGGEALSVNTKLVVDATGLSTWQDSDDGQFMLLDVGYVSAIDTFFASNTPAPGDTAVANLTYAWEAEPLTRPQQTTAARFLQLRTQHDDALNLDFKTPVKWFRSDPLAIADAATVHVAGSFEDPRTLDVSINWARSAFAGQAAQLHVAGCDQGLANEELWVHALPGAGAHGDPEHAFDGALFGIPSYGPIVAEAFTFDETDLVGTLHVANPYPPEWLFAKYSLLYGVACPLPDGRIPGNATSEIGVLTTDLGTAAVSPLVGPVHGVQIAGRDLSAPQTAVGAMPTLAWMPPAFGTATAYEVHLYEVDNGAFGGLFLHEDAVLLVPGDVTSITLPPEVLAEGTGYTIRIRAISRAGQAARTAPFRSGMPLGYADFLTNYFLP